MYKFSYSLTYLPAQTFIQQCDTEVVRQTLAQSAQDSGYSGDIMKSQQTEYFVHSRIIMTM